MSYNIINLLSYSVGIASVLALLRFQRIPAEYRPFVYLLWAGLLTEIAAGVLYNGRENIVPYNLFSLVEPVLILYQFRKWQLFERRRPLYLGLQGVFVLAWCLENLVFWHFAIFDSYFIIFYSFLVVLLSIHQINKLIVTTDFSLLRNPRFIICVGFIIYFTYSAVTEVFWRYGLDNEANQLRKGVSDFLVIVNLFTNLVYAFAVLWIPRKQKFLLQS